MNTTILRIGLPAVLLGLSGAAFGAAPMASLRVCADPGNMPFSNNRGEGFEQKISEVIAESLGTTVQYYYRPTMERGLTRQTLGNDNCDLMLDLPADSEGVLATSPLYRSTFVLASRTERQYDFKSLDDPRLKTLKVGVYQTSAVREALDAHDVRSNVVVHYLTHDADLKPEDQPVYQMQQVVDGELDVAAAWGPFAGYYQVAKHAPITVTPVNLMDESVPLEFDMTLGVRTRDRAFRDSIENAVRQQKDRIHAILVQFGVPLVHCEDCVIDGDLPSHGPYHEKPQYHGPAVQNVTIAMLDDWLAHGAKPSVELNNAVVADDPVRVSYLIEKKHTDINAKDPQGYTPLLNAVRRMSPNMVTYLVDHGADVSRPDNDGWTPVMTAAWLDQGDLVQYLAAHKANLNARNPNGLTPLGVASEYGKDVAVVALIQAGCNVNERIGSGYTPLMLAIAGHSDRSAKALLDHGADVNARNSGGITALMIAAAANEADLVTLLINAGADRNAKDENGNTALAIAQDKGNEAVVQVLSKASG